MRELIEYIIASVPILSAGPKLIIYLLFIFIGAGVMLAYLSIMVIIWVYLERKVAGHIQARYGPMRVGPHGIVQTVADAIKLLMKEDIVIPQANKLLFSLAPFLVFFGVFAPFVVVPFSEKIYLSRMNVGVFYLMALVAVEVIGIIMAGWGSNNKWALYGGMRHAAQMISYELPMGISMLTVVVFSGSLTLHDITHTQGVMPWEWFISPLKSPFTFIAAFIFFVSGLAACKRVPFDLPEAESELVAGYHAEYSGMRFAFFFLAEYTAMYLISAVTAILFLGGWRGPLPAPLGLINMLAKTYFLLFVMLWLRWTLPRLRIDQLLNTSLKYMLPISLLALLGSALQSVLF